MNSVGNAAAAFLLRQAREQEPVADPAEVSAMLALLEKPMTAGELAQVLSALPPDTEIVARAPHCCGQGHLGETSWFRPQLVPFDDGEVVGIEANVNEARYRKGPGWD